MRTFFKDYHLSLHHASLAASAEDDEEDSVKLAEEEGSEESVFQE